MFLKSFFLIASTASMLAAEPLTFVGTEGPGKGKHLVFIANDHEYRSEETCPAIAKILAKHHGFRCTVLFGVDEEGHIKAGAKEVPGMEALKDADLLVFYTRFMNLPDAQADLLVDYFERGGPTVGIRTSTHCFNGQKGKWAKLNYNYEGEDYLGGLGEQVYGNTWHRERGQSHYGSNHRMSCLISATDSAKAHAILAGVRPLHAFSGGYKSQPPVGAVPLLDLQVLNTFWPSQDFHTESPVVCAGWTRDSYRAPSGDTKDARVVYTSFGASEDLYDESARRFLVNACFWASGMEEAIESDLNVSFVGDFNPSPYTTGAFFRVGVKPADLAGWDSAVMPANSKHGGLEGDSKKVRSRADRVLKVRPELAKALGLSEPSIEREVKK